MKNCVECGKEFEPKEKYKETSLYCSKRCKRRINCRKWRNTHKKIKNDYNKKWMKEKRKDVTFSAKSRWNYRKWYYTNKDSFKDELAFRVYIRKITLENKDKLFLLLKKECKICKSNENIQFHHISYVLPNGEDLITRLLKITIPLCKPCHQKLHKEIKRSIHHKNCNSDDCNCDNYSKRKS